jgi:REP element-mobilizing transposase RayT
MSYTNLIYHIVFGTKDRRPFIDEALRKRLVEYLGGMINRLGGSPIKINGPADHVHILAWLPPTVALSDALCKLKSGSSGWVRREVGKGRFGWQDEYSAFTVSKSQVARIRRYVENQRIHHAKMTFAEELRLLLERHGIEYDERYL